MVYGGKPSTGCYLCRKRKIKCDEALPECRNCVVYGRPCPGYRPDAVFRDETLKVQQLVKKAGSSSASSSQRPPSTSQSQGTLVRRAESESLTLYPVADATWEERAVCYFFDQYTILSDDTEDIMGHLDFLPGLYARCGELDRGGGALPSSCLRSAVDATALVTLANAINAPPLATKARQGYGKALRGLRQALSSPAQAVQDETFAVVVLLSLFEDIAGERNGLFSSHTAGFELLMQLRGETQLYHQRGRDMFNFAYAHTYVEVLALGDKPRFSTEWILGLLDNSDPIQRLMAAASKISQLFLAMRSSQSPPDQETVETWIAAGRACDLELSEWSQHLPDRWLPLNCYSEQGEPLITYNRISNAVIWNYYRAVRVVLQQLLLTLHRTLTSITANNTSAAGITSTVDARSLRAVIQEMTTDVCRSIPFSLGDVDTLGRPTPSLDGNKEHIRAAQAYGLLWPLWYVLSCGMPTPAQVAQIRTVLSRVGSAMGIKLALILADEAERMRGDHAFSPLVGSEQR